MMSNPAVQGRECVCITCWEGHAAQSALQGKILFRPFIVCSQCGNKRCPKATFHGNACTDSNKPGQAGSSYA